MFYRYIDFTLLSWHRGVVVITCAELHSTDLELRFCTDANLVCLMYEIRDGEDLWQWSQLEVRLNRDPLGQPYNKLNSSLSLPLFSSSYPFFVYYSHLLQHFKQVNETYDWLLSCFRKAVKVVDLQYLALITLTKVKIGLLRVVLGAKQC